MQDAPKIIYIPMRICLLFAIALSQLVLIPISFLEEVAKLLMVEVLYPLDSELHRLQTKMFSLRNEPIR